MVRVLDKSSVWAEPLCRAGDIVKIVDEPYTQCLFVWVKPMNDVCGRYVVVENVRHGSFKRPYAYQIRVGGLLYSFCKDCIDYVVPEEKIECPDVTELLDMIRR